MGPKGARPIVGSNPASNQEGNAAGAAEISKQQPWPLADVDANSSSGSSARRSRVYDSIMAQWKQAASSTVPAPRSSHRRVLGGQALPTRQRAESFSLENGSGSSPSRSWGNLKDTVSDEAQSAWREQLLQLKLSRLAAVPMTVLVRQGNTGTANGCRVVAAPRDSSARRTALAVVQGTCANVSVSEVCSLPMVGVVSSEGVPLSGWRTKGRTPTASLKTHPPQAVEQQQQQRQLGKNNTVSKYRGGDVEETAVEEPLAGNEEVHQACTNADNSVMVNRSTDRCDTGRGASPPLTQPPSAMPPVRGFHLVDLHAVVRNSVEWSYCLPQVEPCYRVSSNRDSVLLGLVHALGGRLTCSSAHDIKAGVGAARRASPTPAPPPRLLDRHVCRSPVLLRASVAAGVQMYEVDSVDEWHRICATRRKLGATPNVWSRSGTSRDPTETTPRHSRATELSPASVMIRLAMPLQPRRQFPENPSATPTDADFSEALEAKYGASSDDVVELAQAAAAAATAVAAATVGPELGAGTAASKSCGSLRMLPIVGFSIDVGSSCWNDALRGSSDPSSGQQLPDNSCTSASSVPGAVVSPGRLAESIDAAIAFAVKMARIAAEATAAAAAAAACATAPVSKVGGVAGRAANQQDEHSVRVLNSSDSTAGLAKMAAPNLSTMLPPPFSFRRLHVTGLGEGGARGEPLAALKASLSRHLPIAAAVTATLGGTHGDGSVSASPSVARACGPIVVSADATEHLVASGVWSTVASIIGRKTVPPAAVDKDDPAVARSPAATDTDHGSSSSSIAGSTNRKAPAREQGVVDAGDTCGDKGCDDGGGVMYYVDDGCYGSLSGALLRGTQMRPSTLRVRPAVLIDDHKSAMSPASSNAANETRVHCQTDHGPCTSDALAHRRTACRNELPCTVWGPTCDGLDCVCRMTQLPEDMEPGRDWLFFPDVGIRGGADVTGFNGLKPLETFYFVRSRRDAATPRVPLGSASGVS